MSEDIQTPSTPPEGAPGQGAVLPETGTQVTDSPPQGDNQPQPETPGQVEPGKNENASNERETRRNYRPSDYKAERLEKAALRAKIEKLESLLEQRLPPPASQKPVYKEWTDDDVVSNPGKAFNALRDELLSIVRKEYEEKFPDYYEKYHTSLTEKQEQQAIKDRYSELQESGGFEKMIDLLEQSPEINNDPILLAQFNKDPLMAIAVVDTLLKSKGAKPVSPLAPKKARMGIAGSGQPLNGGQSKPTFQELQKRKDELQSQFGEKFRDPEFMKEWNRVSDELSRVAKETAGV